MGCFQQIDGVAEGGGGGTDLVHRETAQPMQEPPLEPLHLIEGDHEAAIAAADPTAHRLGDHQGVPPRAMGGGKKQRAIQRQPLLAQHLHLLEIGRQGNVLGDHRGQGSQPGAHAVAEAALAAEGCGEIQLASGLGCLCRHQPFRTGWPKPKAPDPGFEPASGSWLGGRLLVHRISLRGLVPWPARTPLRAHGQSWRQH